MRRSLSSIAFTPDEPAEMRRALAEQGVPASATTLDDAGFRTLDSFARKVYK